MSQSPFKLKVYDNFHYMDEEEAYTTGSFNTYEEALQRAKEIVESSLRESYKPGMSSAELLTLYRRFGSDPIIIGSVDSNHPGFSAWSYAEEKAKEMCS